MESEDADNTIGRDDVTPPQQRRRVVNVPGGTSARITCTSVEADNVERPGDAREEAMALQLSGATRKAPAVTTIQVVLLMWIAGVFLWMRWFWVHEAVFPHVARAIAGGKEDVEPRVLLWALVVPFVLLGITVKSAQRASVWELRRSSAFVWLQNSSLRRTLGIDPVDAVAFAVFAILQLNCLFGKLYIDRRSGKLAKSGYIKCTAKALGLNGLVTMVLALVLMARQSFPLKLVNISSERASRYHVWLGQYTVLALGLHGALYCIVWIQTDRMPGVIMPCIDCSAKESYKSFRNFSGLAGYIALLIVACASIERVRRMHFQWFSIIHTLNVAFIVLTCNHYAPAVIWLTPALLIYSLYRAISLFTRNRVQVMGAKALSPEVLQLTLRRAHAASNSVDFSPGQYVYLKVPAISNRQWHPFSISSSPLRDRNSFQIDAKVEGPFTQALRHRIQTDSVGEIVVDGFYGSSIHPCAHMIFVAGGSGITPFLSMLEHLVLQSENERHEHDGDESTKRPPESVWVVWSCRERELINAHLHTIENATKNSHWVGNAWVHHSAALNNGETDQLVVPSHSSTLDAPAPRSAFRCLAPGLYTYVFAAAAVGGVATLLSVYTAEFEDRHWWLRRTMMAAGITVGTALAAMLLLLCIHHPDGGDNAASSSTSNDVELSRLESSPRSVLGDKDTKLSGGTKQMPVHSGRPKISTLLAQIHASIRDADPTTSDVGLFFSGPSGMQQDVLHLAATFDCPTIHCHRKSFAP